MSARNIASPLKTGWIFHDELGGYLLQKGQNKQLFDRSLHGDIEPFITSDKILTAQACVRGSEPNLSDNVSFGIAELHPSTMELCDINIGSPILICANSANDRNNRSALKAWPSLSVAPGKVSLFKDSILVLNIKENDFINVRKVTTEVVLATSASLYPESNSTQTELPISTYLERYLSQVLEKRYFVQDQRIMVEYFGRKAWFTIQCEHSGKFKTKNNSPLQVNGITSVEEINNEFENISIKEYQPQMRNMKTNGVDEPPCKDTQVYQVTEASIQIAGKRLDAGTRQSANDACNTTFLDIGGLAEQIQKLKNLVELPLQQPESYINAGLLPSTGIILHGPPGTGKSMLLKAFTNYLNCPISTINVGELSSKNNIEGEQRLKKIFTTALNMAPSLVIIDNIDHLFPNKELLQRDSTKGLDYVFSDILDKVTSFNKQCGKYVIVLSATNSVDGINPKIRRAGRLDCELEIPIPSPSNRLEIFTKQLNGYCHSLQPSDMEQLAEKAHGYVGSDIAAVCKEAGRILFEKCVGKQACDKVLLSLSDVEAGMKKVPPSAMRELVVQVPKVLWSDIGGNADVKKKLKQTVEWPLKHPEAFSRLGIDPPSGVLLYGPPGCSKTLTAKALATESGLNFISIKGPELFSKYVGDSERAIRKIFAKARAASPSIIFIDELDALAGERTGKSSSTGGNVTDRVLATLLTELDGVESRQDVIIVAATNRPDRIDKALLRPGRIDRIIHVPLPDDDTRGDIFRIQFKRIPTSSSVDINHLVMKTKMYSGAEICAVCREAALAALERDMETSEVNENDFVVALSAIPPQTSEEVVRMYEEYDRTLQSGLKG